MTPSVGRIVHYLSFGTPGGEYPKTCRAAVITGLGEPLTYPTRGAVPARRATTASGRAAPGTGRVRSKSADA